MKNRTFKRVYLLYGDEDFLKRSFRNRLKNAVAGDDEMNLLQLSGKAPDLNRLKEFSDTMPFFAEKRLILLEDTGLFRNASEGYTEWIENLPDTACVIFTESETDKRNRLFKKVSEIGYAAELSHPDEKALRTWVLQYLKSLNMNIRADAYDLFLDCVTEDMDDIRNQLDKVAGYCQESGIIEKKDVEAVCTLTLKSRIFDLTTQASLRNKREAMRLYYDLIALKEPPMRILYLLSRELDRLYLVKKLLQEGKGKSEITAILKVKPFIGDKIIRQTNMYTEKQLEVLLDLSLTSEEQVKTGSLDERMAAEFLILKMTER